MVNDNFMVLLSFSITPVQRFIEAARTVRDLKTGSEILCWLTDRAIRAGKEKGGSLLFPWINDSEFNDVGYVKHIPNQFIMTFKDRDAAKQAEDACRVAVQNAWRDLADKVRGLLDTAWRGLNWNPGNEWDRQINSFWDLHTAVIPPADDALYKHLFGGASENDPWRRQWKVAAAVLAMNKQVRHFPGDQGIGRAKCSMMGDFEQMGPGGKLKQQNDFWTNRKVAAFSRSGIRIGQRDRLCAVALTKRFAPACGQALKHLEKEIPDTATFAIQAWVAGLEGETAEAYKQWTTAAAAYCKAMGEEADRPGRYLLADQLAEPNEEIPEGQDPSNVTSLFNAMKSARVALDVARKRANMDAPPHYFAVLALDGDHMGKWLSGDPQYVGVNLLSEDHYQKMSDALRKFGETVKGIIERYHGHLVYAGGDDLLAFVPVREALRCAIELQSKYPQLPGVKETTASVGIAICHYLHDLRSALRQARVALEDAKDNGRNRIGWRLLKRSGGDLQGILERGLAGQVLEMTKRFEEGLSDRWVYRLAETSAQLHPDASLEAAGLLCRHTLKGVEGSAAEKEGLEQAVEALWYATKCALRIRNNEWNERVQDPDQRRGGAFTLECLGAFLDALLLAVFIVRGRD